MGERTGRFERSDRLRDSRDFRRVSRRGRRSASRDFVVLVAPQGSLTTAKSRGSRGSGAQPGVPLEARGGRGDLDENAAPRVPETARLGITASRKVGNAVVRNRVKRAVREWYRHNRARLEPGVDIVVIARRSAAALDHRGIEAALNATVAASVRKLR